ncbi:hypothetical protein EIP86_010651 [Pleurotus ostreatoroseus]|nr:hypothetical protein EIP86_010651 [Pleurotus ostreatoroseus]
MHANATQGDTISPEDYTTLFGWITFRWISPLIARGTQKTLNETDIWDLSPTMQARPLHMKFSATHRDTLLRRLWAANSRDLLMDFGLTYVSVIFNYLGPFFLKNILDSLDARDRASLTRAYIYAVLALLSTLCKVQADLQHLWYAKRATTRIKSELMVAIYDKALKRKDLSGIVDKEKTKRAKTSEGTATSYLE